jgi:hypothetical protein
LVENIELEKSEVKTPAKTEANATGQTRPEVLDGNSAKDASPMLGGQNQVAAVEREAEHPLSEVENGGKTGKPPRETPSRIRSPELQLIEKFAIAQGFHKNGNEGYAHSDGRVLIKSEGAFHWEVISPGEARAFRFWVKEHCLEAKPLDLPTEIWNMLEKAPYEHVLLLEDRNREPKLYYGNDLLLLNKEGRLNLYSATYRIVLESEN